MRQRSDPGARAGSHVDIRDSVEDWTLFAPLKAPEEAPRCRLHRPGRRWVLGDELLREPIETPNIDNGMSPLFIALGNPGITPAALDQKIINAVMEEAGTRSEEQLAQEENELLVGLLRLGAKAGKT